MAMSSMVIIEPFHLIVEPINGKNHLFPIARVDSYQQRVPLVIYVITIIIVSPVG